MKPYTLILIVFCLIAPYANAAQERQAATDEVVSCQTLEEVNKAKAADAVYIEFKGRYWIRVGESYKGSYKTLETAKRVKRRYEGKGTSSKSAKDRPFYHPKLILFPFVDESSERGRFLTLPDGQKIASSKVMIHPEPLMFDEVSFGPIDLNRVAQTIAKKRVKDGTDPDVSLSGNLKTYFAVTGKIVARTTIVLATDSLDYWVGAAVVGVDGTALVKTYGIVGKDLGFRCLVEIPFSTITPHSLLLFTLAKGQLDTMLCPLENVPPQDVSSYEYHVLSSMLLEIGPDWFPPLEKATKEEMLKILESMQGRRAPPGAASPRSRQ